MIAVVAIVASYAVAVVLGWFGGFVHGYYVGRERGSGNIVDALMRREAEERRVEAQWPSGPRRWPS